MMSMLIGCFIGDKVSAIETIVYVFNNRILPCAKLIILIKYRHICISNQMGFDCGF